MSAMAGLSITCNARDQKQYEVRGRVSRARCDKKCGPGRSRCAIRPGSGRQRTRRTGRRLPVMPLLEPEAGAWPLSFPRMPRRCPSDGWRGVRCAVAAPARSTTLDAWMTTTRGKKQVPSSRGCRGLPGWTLCTTKVSSCMLPAMPPTRADCMAAGMTVSTSRIVAPRSARAISGVASCVPGCRLTTLAAAESHRFPTRITL